MSGAADGIGDILTGGLVAGEVDRVGGGTGFGGAAHADHEGAGGECLNCGAVRTGPFCQACGQSGHVHRNVMALGHDILHGVFHFDGKFWNTLPLIAWHPGELTRRYVRGERAKFVTPMAMFLFSIFLLFAAVNRLTMPDVAGAAQGLAKARVQMDSQAKKAGDKLAGLEQKRSELVAADAKADTAALDKQIKDSTNEVAALKAAASQLPAEVPSASNLVQVHTSDKTYDYGIADDVKGFKVDTGSRTLDQQLEHVKANPELYAYKLKMASYKFSWALIPISVPFIWLMFLWRRDVGFYDHAIFAIHSLSFMTLLAVGLIGLYLIGVKQAWLWCAWLIVPPVHMYKHLKYAYGLGRFGATWRTFTLLVMTTITSSLFFALLLWLEAE
ncbi:DUF3667 domain-containing protein [Sphingomonas abietis]|uniref:DUF3667 domain-containing protein n=1 Tax=Sphingomonas abietis TaxID=3012344 RepID=A0ABY7NN50_9SPHN|nr:DUF3667 domain-containing protein [Sphingomonas abietis]WBO22943.1 DUF3667 domain-containing protein [Sphingomonas abietis]